MPPLCASSSGGAIIERFGECSQVRRCGFARRVEGEGFALCPDGRVLVASRPSAAGGFCDDDDMVEHRPDPGHVDLVDKTISARGVQHVG